MKIQATKKMVNMLNKYAKDKQHKFNYVEIAPDRYRILVDYDLIRNERDFNFETGLFKAIEVKHDPGLYAMTAYLTTNDLNRLFKDGDTVDSYCKRVVDATEV